MKKKKLANLLFMLFAFLMVLLNLILIFRYQVLEQDVIEKMAKEQNGQVTESESDYVDESEAEIVSEIESEVSTEVIIQTAEDYLNQWALDYVEPPVKRTREEAIERIKELAEEYPALQVVYENEESYYTELLLSGAGNPEMAEYLCGYLESDGSVLVELFEDETPENYPLFLQWDPRWGYMQYGSQGTIGSSGCGPTCLAMAVYYLTGNTECMPDAVAQYSLEHGHYLEGIGTEWALLDNYPTQYGLKVSHPSLSEANLKAQLDKGNILICSVKPGDFTAEGHFIVIYGYDENGFQINDPKCIYRSRLSWTYEQIKDDIKRIWAVGE